MCWTRCSVFYLFISFIFIYLFYLFFLGNHPGINSCVTSKEQNRRRFPLQTKHTIVLRKTIFYLIFHLYSFYATLYELSGCCSLAGLKIHSACNNQERETKRNICYLLISLLFLAPLSILLVYWLGFFFASKSLAYTWKNEQILEIPLGLTGPESITDFCRTSFIGPSECPFQK